MILKTFHLTAKINFYILQKFMDGRTSKNCRKAAEGHMTTVRALCFSNILVVKKLTESAFLSTTESYHKLFCVSVTVMYFLLFKLHFFNIYGRALHHKKCY